MLKRVVLLLPLLLAACSQTPEDPAKQAESMDTPTPAASGSAPAAFPPAAEAMASQYTSLKDCKVVRSGEGEGENWSESLCDGLGGWRLAVNYGDARESMDLFGAGWKGVTSEPATANSVSHGAGFNAFGEQVEWRGHGEGDTFKPIALIVRNSVTVDPETGRRESLLLVADLAQRCLIAKVQPGPGQNEKARAIADGPRRACLPG